MQKISNDIDTHSQAQSHSVVSDAIKASSENLANIINFSRRNLSNVTIVKKDGTKEKYNIEKVVEAIKKSATRMLVEFSEREIKDICAFVNKSVSDMNKDEVKYILLSDGVANIISQYIDYQDEILKTFETAFSSFTQTKTIRSGIDTIFEIPEFRDVDRIKEIMTAINDESINSLIAAPTRGLSVRIGQENNIQVMADCAVVSVPYQIGDEEGGTIAVIGPTRMEYKRVIPLLEYIAKNMSKLFK